MLFNKDNNGSAELQTITGTFAASNDYSVISSEVDDAMRTVASLVGTAVVSAAEAAYSDGLREELVNAVRQSVAVLAVCRYSARNLVTHDDSGSKIRVDANEKVPFEWMIDRDERAQKERYYRAMDALYGYLETAQVSEWIGSDVRKTYLRSIVRTLREFEAVYPVDGSYYVFYMFQSLVIECQPSIRKMIGESRWTSITAASVTDDDLDILRLCQRSAILSAVARGVKRWSLEVFPLSIARRFAPSYQGNRESRTAAADEMEAYVAGLEAQLRETREELATLLASGINPYADFDPMPSADPSNKFFSAQ